MVFMQNLVHVSIHPLHNIWLRKHLGEASGDSPSLSLMQGWLPPLPPSMFLAYPPPPL